jgi:hypothetical protein
MKITTKNKSKIWDIKLYDSVNDVYIETPSDKYLNHNTAEEFFAISVDGTKLVYCRNGGYITMHFPIENVEIILDTDKNEISDKKTRE